MVSQTLGLFVRRVMLFIDDDQTESRQGRKHRQPRSQHNGRLASPGFLPPRQPFAFSQPAVQAYQFKLRKSSLDVRFELRREIDFRHQQQGLLSACGNLLDQG